MFEKLATILENTEEALITIGKFCDYVIHPVKIFVSLWNGLYVISLPVCTTITLVCIMLYIMGYKQCGKGVTLSSVTLIAIKAIGKITLE